MLSTNLQNTTNDDFSFQLAGRYLTYDKVGFGSELRLDAAAGSSSSVAAELYRPIGQFPGDAVSVGLPFGWDRHMPVSVTGSAAPEPTIAARVDLRPEAFRDWSDGVLHGGHYNRHTDP
jgi:hypothetical protein